MVLLSNISKIKKLSESARHGQQLAFIQRVEQLLQTPMVTLTAIVSRFRELANIFNVVKKWLALSLGNNFTQKTPQQTDIATQGKIFITTHIKVYTVWEGTHGQQ